MTEVAPADRTRLLQSKRAECSAIARSRKRKLCVLYAIATTSDGLPQRSFTDPDAPPNNAAESLFLEDSDILKGRKLNELNIPARPRVRSEYPLLPRSSDNYLPNENLSHASLTKKKDVGTAARPSIPSSSVASRPVTGGDGQNNVASISPTSGLGVKPSPPAWAVPSAGRPRPDPHPVPVPVSVTANDQPQPRFPPVGRVEDISKNNKPDGVPETPLALPTGPSPPNVPKAQAVQAPKVEQPANEQQQQRQLQQQVPPRVDVQRESARVAEPMDIDTIPPKKQEEKPVVVQPVAQPNTGRQGDQVVSSGSMTRPATSPPVPDLSTHIRHNREGVPFAEPKQQVGMKDLASMKQNSQNLTRSGPVVAGISESIPDQVKIQTVQEPASATTATTMVKTPINGTRDTGATSTLVPLPPQIPQIPQIPLSSTNLSQPGTPGPPNFSNSSASVLASSQPTVQQPSSDAFGDIPMVDKKSSQQQATGGSTNLSTPNNTESVVQVKDKHEVRTKESLAASVEPIPIPRVSPQVTQETQLQSPTPTQPPQSDHEKPPPTGVSQQKPVAEILSEPPKFSRESESSHGALATPTSQSFRSHSQNLLQRAQLKEKSKHSTVVFGKQPKRTMDSDKSLVQNQPKADQMPSEDYFTPLFVQAFTNNSKWMKPLDQVLHQSHKTLSTPDSYTQIHDNQACKVLKRVYHLQHHNKWSLRQPKRCPEPVRQPCHWDVLLKEMKWMRTDFREERKWKMAAARNLAYDCAEWVAASAEERKAMQVNAIIPPLTSVDAREVSMEDAQHAQNSDNQPTPDLIPSAESDSPLDPDDEPQDGIQDTVAPSAIFALDNDDVVFALHQSATADRLLEELPMYGSPLKVPKSDLTAPEYDPDASWRRPALPLSKFVEGRMELTPTEPPSKRSRFRYAQEDDEDDEVVFGQDSGPQPRLEPQNPDVALFRPENKSFRDRLHAGHQFRPPNEHTMPFQSFYESRTPSQWIQSEDDELKSLVREYSYNWSLISSILASKAMFSSGAERRTPWECFERWVMLEGLPHDMQKTQYFKLWQGRIEASQQVIRQHQNAMQQQAQQQQQQAGSNGPVTPIPKRRYNVPLKVERRRNQKHLTMIDAMRKLAKKRETAIQKQQHAASLAAMRKTTDQAPQPRAPIKTPREYSIMRFERDQAMAERLAERMAQQQRHENQRRAAMQRAQQGQQMAAAQSVNQLSQNNPQMAASHPHAGMARVNAPNQIPMNGQARPRMPMHATPNGTGATNHMGGGLVPPMQMNGTSQVQMPSVNGQSRMAMPASQPDMQLLMQAQQISEQQRRSVQMRQQQQQAQQQQSHQNPQGGMPLQSSPPAMRAAAMNGLNQKNYLNNAQAQAMMAASFSSANGSGMSTPPAPTLPMTSQAGSPRPNTTMPQHQTYVSQLQHIESQIRQQHPNTPQDMVREMARQLLNNRHNNHNHSLAQSAMNAAAGGTGHAAAANGPHQYAQLLRAQQQQQAAAAAAAQAQHAQAQAQAHSQAQAQAQAQAQQGAQQHQRNSSGSATPTPSLPK